MIIRNPDQLTSVILTNCLAEAGLLQQGFVTSFRARSNQSTPFIGNSITHLHLEFSPEASTNAPSTLVFKINIGPKENFFYKRILPLISFRIAPDVFYALYDTSANTSNFLMEDLSDSHWQTQWPLPPSFKDCKNALSAIAKLHAHWWSSPFLHQDHKEKLPGGNWWEARIDLAVDRIGGFLDFMGDRISQERRSIYELVISSSNQVWRPGNGGSQVTLLHGDAHFWNFLFPHDIDSHPVIMIDWNSWDIGRSSDELAYMMALHWYQERRTRYEKSLLEHYYQALISGGVSGYEFDELILDYRHSLIMNMFIPVWQWEKGIHPSSWWFHLERSYMAFDDWDCKELLE